MSKRTKRWLLLALLFLTAQVLGCATAFTGDAKVESGVSGCRKKCEGWGMELSGMVAMGEYSDGCICRVPGQTASLEPAGALVGGVAGVAMQMQRAQQQQAAAGVR
jgi:hypothetical protein